MSTYRRKGAYKGQENMFLIDEAELTLRLLATVKVLNHNTSALPTY
jgi:hypothetical protein